MGKKNEDKSQHDLKERVKELNCLYGLSRLMENQDISMNEFLQSAVDLIPPAWQYPEITCARLFFNEMEFKTKGFKETQWKQSANIVVNNKTKGRLDVFYLEEKPVIDEGPFLKEERNILNSFVKNLGQYLDRKAKEENLRRNKEILTKTQELAIIGNWELDLATNHLSWSDEVYRIFGLKPQEFSATYQAFLEYVHPDDRAKVDRAYASSLEEGRDTYEIEHRVVRKHNGEIRYVYEKCYHERNREGKVFRSVGIVQDVTKQREIENALRESRENLRITINSIGDAVIATDTKGHITRMNPVAEELTGWSSIDAENQHIEKVFNIVNAKSGKKAENPVKEVLDTGKIIGLANDTKLISKNGEEYQIADSGSPIKDHNGEITGVVLVFRDVTEDYQIREELKDSEERFRTTLETMNEGCQIIGFDWRYIYVNQTLVEHGHKSRNELLGRTMMEVYPGIEKTEMFDSLRKCMSERVSQRFENQFTYPDGSTGWFDLSIQPSAEGIFIFSIDVTKRKEAEEKIRENERQLATLMGNLPGMAYRCRNDKNWTMEFVSSGCLSLTGYNDKQLTYNFEVSYAGLIHPDDRDKVRKETQKAIQNNQPFLIEYRIHDNENNLKWVWE
ncbi:MAG: PAS domain-containing protein, partial [Bacteroidota bacterium]